MIKYFAPNPIEEDELYHLKLKVRSLMNGSTVESMNKLGLQYKKNYGVSLVHLKELAQKVSLKVELTKRLWVSDIREFKILACLLPHKQQGLSIEEINDWVSEIQTMELALISTMYFFNKLDCINQWAVDVLDNIADLDESFHFITALLILSRNPSKDRGFDCLLNKRFSTYPYVDMAMTKALVSYALLGVEEKKKVMSLLAHNPSFSAHCREELTYI